MELCLTKDEIQTLTHKTYAGAQARELNRLGIENKRRSDGTVLVYRHHLLSATGKAERRKREPDFGALDGT